MRKILFLSVVLLLSATSRAEKYSLVIENDSDIARTAEMVEIEVDNADKLAVFDSNGVEVPSQVTHKGNLIFQVDIDANSERKYKLAKIKGARTELKTIATGRVYPEHYDDVAWENDKIGWRIYAAGSIADGAKLYGYDIFTKRREEPVLDILYALQFDTEYRALRKHYKAENPTKEKALTSAVSYHLDHGLGMDYYAVGPTLGCGTCALRTDEGLHYQTYYTSYELLDAGGLRFSFKVTFDPIEVGNDLIVESRIITLDAGSHFNYIEVDYQNLSRPTELVTGLVLRDNCEVSAQGQNYIAYAEPKHDYGWQTYNAVIYPDDVDSKVNLFDEAARKAHGGAKGYIQTESICTPNETVRYYVGAGWNRWGFETPELWFDYVAGQAAAKQKPLTYRLK